MTLKRKLTLSTAALEVDNAAEAELFDASAERACVLLARLRVRVSLSDQMDLEVDPLVA